MLYQLLAIVGISLGVSFLCSILEAVILSVTHGYVHVLRDRGSKAGVILHRDAEADRRAHRRHPGPEHHRQHLRRRSGRNPGLQDLGRCSTAIFSAGLTLAILLFSEILPKTLGATLWPRLAPSAAYVLRGLIFITKPLVIPLTLYSRLITAGPGSPQHGQPVGDYGSWPASGERKGPWTRMNGGW